MHIRILAIGKKRSDYDETISMYLSRITGSFSVALEILELAGIDSKETSRIKEAEKIITKISTGEHVVILDETGKDLSTEAFADFLNKKLIQGIDKMVFVIGGSYGLDETVRMRADTTLRLSSFTFPHELARLVLAEQLYRVTNLLAGGKYHH